MQLPEGGEEEIPEELTSRLWLGDVVDLEEGLLAQDGLEAVPFLHLADEGPQKVRAVLHVCLEANVVAQLQDESRHCAAG